MIFSRRQILIALSTALCVIERAMSTNQCRGRFGVCLPGVELTLLVSDAPVRYTHTGRRAHSPPPGQKVGVGKKNPHAGNRHLAAVEARADGRGRDGG